MSSTTQKQIKEHFNEVMIQQNQHNNDNSGHVPTLSGDNFHRSNHVHYPDGSHLNIPTCHDTNTYNYSDKIMALPENNYPDYDTNIQPVPGDHASNAKPPVTSDNAPPVRFQPKRFPLYEPYKKSPCQKYYKIENSRNSPVDSSSVPRTFVWKSSNPELHTPNCRHSSGVDFAIFPKEIYQTLHSVCPLYAPVSPKAPKPRKADKDTHKKSNRDSRMTEDSQMTFDEDHLEVYDELDEDVYNVPTEQTPNVVLSVADYTQTLNDISPEGIRGNNQAHHNNGSNICSSCQQIYDSNNNVGIANISVLTPRSESDAQSTDILNVSRDQILANNRRKNNGECCTIL